MGLIRHPIRKIVGAVVFVGLFGTGIGWVVKNYLGSTGKNNGATPALATPTNITYDATTGTFSWDPVEHATKYEVKINEGPGHQVAETTYTFTCVDATTKITVQALTSDKNYNPSELGEYTYNLPA